MTDSESDISNPNVFTFQNVNTTVSARGPNTNITNFSFRNNQLTSSMYMPRNFERSRYAESVSDQRSIYYRRETSPMSIHSACDIRPRNFQQYYNGMGSHQSVYNGRSGSPVSMRSIDSSASVSAADIAFAFKNVKFNKYDLRVIKEAYNKLMKQRFRKRIEKRRNMKLFLKGSRHRSGDDSGEQGSDSSISSDDCRSVKTSYKENMSCTGSARMNLTEFRKTVRDNNMFKDYTDNINKPNFKNMFSINTSNRNLHNFNNTITGKQNNPAPTLKDRFKNGFVLPSQRFNRSVASSVIPESSEKRHQIMDNNYRPKEFDADKEQQNKICESGSEEEIFSGVSIREKSTCNAQKEISSKRSLDSDDDSNLPNKKKSKISSPVKNSQSNRKMPSNTKNSVNNNDENSNNFEFAKPTLPVRKSKTKVQEKVIAKSKQPLTGFVEHIPSKVVPNIESVPSPEKQQEKPSDVPIQDEPMESTQNSDVSMRPSFIKRKLFTQKLDVADKANTSSDGTNSPQNVYSALQKEKNKARKLVTSQSCLNREVQEENNLLDLIHKIVPPDRMNITNQTSINQTKTDVNNSNKKDDEDKWDVTSVISMCNENDVSDTFTDEEIFNSDIKIKGPKKNKKENTNSIQESNSSTNTKQNVAINQSLPRECRIVVENINFNQVTHNNVPTKDTDLTNSAYVSKPTVKSSAKTFWDTDFESDAECQLPTPKSYIKENVTKGNGELEAPNQDFKQPVAPPKSLASKRPLQGPETSRWLNNTKNDTTMNNTLDSSTRKFNISTLSVRSHRITKKKKCCNEVCFQEIKPTKTSKVKPTLQPETKDAKTSKSEITSENASKSENKSKSSSKPQNKNKVTPKPETKSMNTSKPVTKSTKTNDPNKTAVGKTSKKTESRNKTPGKNTKPKTISQNANKSRSTSGTRQKSKEIKPKPHKQINNKKTISKQASPKDRPMRSCRTPSQNRSIDSSRSSRQFDITPLNVVANRLRKDNRLLDSSLEAITPKLEINRRNLTSKVTEEQTKLDLNNEKLVPQSKMSTKKANPSANISMSSLRSHKSPPKTKCKVNKRMAKNIPSHQTPKCDRPVRSCRTPSQNRSIENYKSSIRGR